MLRRPVILAAMALALATGACGKKRPADALDDTITANAAAPGPAADAGKRCASAATYDRIKSELFANAARIRGRDQAEFDRVAAFSVVRMDRPVVKAADEDLGVITCSGVLTLELPPGVQVAGGRRSLSAAVGYTLQPAADGSGEVITLTGADAIVVPLATLAGSRPPDTDVTDDAPLGQSERTADGPGEFIPPRPDPPPIAPPPSAPRAAPQFPPAAPAPPRSPRNVHVEPSYNCARARTRTEQAVCANPALALLDQAMAGQYLSALYAADPRTNAELRRTRMTFLDYRERCRDDACIADAYRGRMREIDDIVGAAR